MHSHLTYGNMVWGSAYQYRLNKLVKLQTKCIRNVCKATYNESTNPLFKKLSIPKLSDVFNIQLGKFMFSYTNNILPMSLQSLFVRNADVHSYHLRHRNDPHIITRNNSIVSRTFNHAAPKLWLSLPANIRNCKSLYSFNYHMKKYVINTY